MKTQAQPTPDPALAQGIYVKNSNSFSPSPLPLPSHLTLPLGELDDWDSTHELEALAYPRQFKPGYVRFIREKQRTHHALRPHMANNPWVFISWVVKEIVSDDEFKAWKRACRAFAPQRQEARREMPPAQPEPAPMPEPPAPERPRPRPEPVAPEPQPDWAAEAPQEPAEAAPVAAKPAGSATPCAQGRSSAFPEPPGGIQ